MSKIDFSRTIGLINENNFKLIQEKCICVFGLGGVGGTALEALVRSGFRKFIIVDKDVVSESNLNRQILYTTSDIGKNKVDAAYSRLCFINSNVEVLPINKDINTINLDELFQDFKIHYIVDAVDDVNSKIKLAKYCLKKEIPFIMSLGMANRLDPNKVSIKKLNKTTDDPLARKVRYEIKKEGLDLSKIDVVTSSETPLKDGNSLHSMMMVPSSAGLNIAYFVLNSIINKYN